MPRIVIPDDAPSVMASSAAFGRLSGHDVRIYDTLPQTPEQLLERIIDADAVLNIRASSRFSADLLRQCPRLRMISIWGTGTDHVDLQEAREKDIVVTNTPAVSAVAVAEHTLSLIFAVARQTVETDRRVRAGQWPRAMVQQLRGKTLGVIGLGAIGREVARLGEAIGMSVLAWTFHPSATFRETVPLDELLRRSDVISLHVRQSADTTQMIRREHFELMKPNAIFINTARGRIVVEADLIQALESHRIAGAGLDVFEAEPLPAGSPLYDLPNVVLSPHSAGITREATEAGLLLAIENVLGFWNGSPANVVS